jgi:hypothetical protein
MTRGTGPCHPVREGSGATTRPMDPDPTSLHSWAPLPPHVPWLRTPPPSQEGSGVTTRPAAPDTTSPLGRAPVPPPVPQVSVGLNKEVFSYNG